MGRRILFVCVALLSIGGGHVVRPTPANAHRSGCHAAHSCPSDTGSYTCGDTGNYTYCGGSPTGGTATTSQAGNSSPGDVDCADFATQAAAQAHLRANPSDPDRLDADHDGIACEGNTGAQDTTPVDLLAASTVNTDVGATSPTTLVQAVVVSQASTANTVAPRSVAASVSPNSIAQTGTFSLPLFALGLVAVGAGLTLRGRRPRGAHFASK